MNRYELHARVRKRDLQGVRALLSAGSPDIDTFDEEGFTPLMHAVKDPQADIEMVRLLLEHGASVHERCTHLYQSGYTVLALALHAGDPSIVEALIDAGADVRFVRAESYDALIDAVHGRDIMQDGRLIELLKLLIAKGVELSRVTTYQESGLRVLSRVGRFDAVQVLLDAGADAQHLKATPLIDAVTLGSVTDVERLLLEGAPLEETDWWQRTAWLAAIQTGDLVKAQLLHRHGANTSASGRCQKPPLSFAVDSHHPQMLRWLIDIGLDVEQADDFGTTPLMDAAASADLQCLEILLAAGAQVDHIRNGSTALSESRSREVAMRLLEAGADPSHLSQEGRRALLGFEPDANADLLDASPEEFQRARTRRFGKSNPEKIDEPFWNAMIRAGVSGYAAAQRFDSRSSLSGPPVWCAQRFGQSITFLPDGRIVQIAGEHEDSYDPDFCIYNDVFVHERNGSISVYGYPEAVFPPTDFHTATLIGEHIYIIGSVGYQGTRRFGETPVYRLDTRTWSIERLSTSGQNPGWIHSHRAVFCAPREITVSGGKIAHLVADDEVHTENQDTFVLDVQSLAWRYCSGLPPQYRKRTPK